MKKTFVCDDTMIITIPIGSLKDSSDGQLMPEKFHCVYKDSYKVFAARGKPKPLGAAQVIAGVFILTLGLIPNQGRDQALIKIYTLPSVLFVISGLLSYAAGRSPNMHVTKLSFSMNIISLFWSISAVVLCAIWLYNETDSSQGFKLLRGILCLIMTLLVVENFLALFLIYWLSKAVCRQHFNTLPIVLLKQGD
ncbi:membrane-spanning 4-domains subfamily A member 4D [Labrus mixtus]|uniref:membrane-spanning 4-domains subfamily A member 4D n=1 Tax=Labrus mixtus TaxID=508554 RepID=UPI0029C0A44B|nr:membrane-spanning 4-domains subfamily A member 4D [Labrus mixtus]